MATFGGRFSRSIVLRELPLDLCVKFWRGREKRLATREILSRNLAELDEAGFVSKDDNVNPTTGRKAKESRYRACDNYVRFYLKYIEPHDGEIRGGRYGFGSP